MDDVDGSQELSVDLDAENEKEDEQDKIEADQDPNADQGPQITRSTTQTERFQ